MCDKEENDRLRVKEKFICPFLPDTATATDYIPSEKGNEVTRLYVVVLRVSA